MRVIARLSANGAILMKLQAWIFSALLAMLPLVANAAELPVPKRHGHVVRHHRVHVAHAARLHFGYYFGNWGWRSGGTGRSWYSSRFVLAGEPGWGEPSTVFASGPRNAPAIVCSPRRPLVCLAEPTLGPVAMAGPPGWR